MFWANRLQLLSAERDALPVLIERLVKERSTHLPNTITEPEASFVTIPNTQISLALTGQNARPTSDCMFITLVASSCFDIPVRIGKRGLEALMMRMPSIVEMACMRLRSTDRLRLAYATEVGADGRDAMVAIALILLCACCRFAQNGRGS